jgi:hypothetical protein
LLRRTREEVEEEEEGLEGGHGCQFTGRHHFDEEEEEEEKQYHNGNG